MKEIQMYETFSIDFFTPREASVVLGLLLGLMFGALAQRTRFCFRRGILGDGPALSLWFSALAFGIIGTQVSVYLGWISFADHRFFTPEVPVIAITLGGLLFGVGMVLTKGCVSRLTVLTGSGNMRALIVLIVFAIFAHATMKGIFSYVRTFLGGFTFDVGAYVDLSHLLGWRLTTVLILAVVAGFVALKNRLSWSNYVMSALIGLLVPAAWVGTGLLLQDEFDPIAMESLSFTLPAAETLFWGLASTAVAANFGTGLFLGTVLGAFVVAKIYQEFSWESFQEVGQTGRYMAGAALMGVGGVLAGGCTLGVGLAGLPTLSLAALIGIVAIAIGGQLAVKYLPKY